MTFKHCLADGVISVEAVPPRTCGPAVTGIGSTPPSVLSAVDCSAMAGSAFILYATTMVTSFYFVVVIIQNCVRKFNNESVFSNLC